jgi:Fe-S cluster assembly ATP-binding protein
MSLIIENLHANINGKNILNGINLEIEKGTVQALMGPNGSGKSTLANVIMGHPLYEVSEGAVYLDGKNILELDIHERSQAGLFLAFQYPVEIPGVTVGKFLKRAVELRQEEGTKMNISAYIKELRANMDYLEIDQQFINRYLNEGFSGGEKKRMEILQMLTLKPRFSILDETDSGLDIDALKIVARGVNRLKSPENSSLIITHYNRILEHIKPDKVHIMYQGKIVKTGTGELVLQLEAEGYDWIKNETAGMSV